MSASRPRRWAVLPLLLTTALCARAGADDIKLDLGAGLDTATIRGQLQSIRHTVLSAGISGRITDFPVRVGSRVKAGDSLVRFDCQREQARKEVAQARLAAAETKLQVNRRLAELNTLSGLDLRLSEAEMAIAQAELKQIRVTLERCHLRAPFAGVVVEKPVQAHQHVAEGDPLLELVDPAALEVAMVVPSAWLARLAPGTGFRLRVDETGEVVEAKVARLVGRIDPVSQSMRVIGELVERPDAVLPGMSGTVIFPWSLKD